MNSTTTAGDVSTSPQCTSRQDELQYAAALYFVKYLRMPVVFDAGVTTDGVCRCRGGRECKRTGKHPVVKDPRSHATTDLDLIGWWIKHGHNLAVVPVNYIVVDCDEGGEWGKQGRSTFRAWCKIAGLDPDAMMRTVAVRTGGGGLQLYYRIPKRMRGYRPRGMDEWLPGVDVKTEHKVSDKATIPGSRHASTELYTFDLHADPDTGEPALYRRPALAPDVLVEEVAAGPAYELPGDDPGLLEDDSGHVTFADVMSAMDIRSRAIILPPGTKRANVPPPSLRVGSSYEHYAWIKQARELQLRGKGGAQ